MSDQILTESRVEERLPSGVPFVPLAPLAPLASPDAHASDQAAKVASRRKKSHQTQSADQTAPSICRNPHSDEAVEIKTLRAENEDLRRQMEHLLSELHVARMESLQAMELKSQFMSNISHELRTPMSGVLGMAELLKEMELSNEQRELVSYIYTSANGLVEVVNGLLDFSRLQVGKLTLERHEFSPAGIVESIRKTYAETAKNKGLSFQIKYPKSVPLVVYGDGLRIKQVLSGLVSNAIKFSESGTIQVSLNVQKRNDNLVFLRFSVKDEGIGIATEDQDTIFAPFFQLDGSNTRKYGGVGLGLSICKRLVKLMSGSIGVQSKLSEGSLFWFCVPVEVKH